jgi:hypothetical protein
VPDNRPLNRQTGAHQGGEYLGDGSEVTPEVEEDGEQEPGGRPVGKPVISSDTIAVPSGPTPDHRKPKKGIPGLTATRRKKRN